MCPVRLVDRGVYALYEACRVYRSPPKDRRTDLEITTDHESRPPAWIDSITDGSTDLAANDRQIMRDDQSAGAGGGTGG
jgi:hypothetical protein